MFFAVVLHHPSEAIQMAMFVYVLQPYWIVMLVNDSGSDRLIRVWRDDRRHEDELLVHTFTRFVPAGAGIME